MTIVPISMRDYYFLDEKDEVMRINEHYVTRNVGRFLGVLFFAALFCLASDCQAQRHRGWFGRSARVDHAVLQQEHTQQAGAENRQSSPRHGIPPRHGVPPGDGVPTSPRPDNPQIQKIYTMDEDFPKFIGGFHSSHFSNLGIPTGDLGFRTNGIYWAPW